MYIIFKISEYLKKNSKLIKEMVIIALAAILVLGVMFSISYKSKLNELTINYEKLFAEKSALESDNDVLKQTVSNLSEQNSQKDAKIKELETQLIKLEQKQSNRQTKTVNKINVNNKSNTQYADAIMVWNHLKSKGLNDYVCAGILGNIMAEVGGHTLDISNWSKYSRGTYFGICQWSGSRKTRLINNFGSSLQAQLDFLTTELFEIIPKDNTFYNIQNEREAALYFAKYYERCNSKYYTVRQQNAVKAYNYFVG